MYQIDITWNLFWKLFSFFTVYTDAGIDLSKPLIGMCNSGMSSCSLVLAAHLCGCPDVAVYHVRDLKFNLCTISLRFRCESH